MNTEAVAQAATDSVPWPIIEIHSAPAIRTYVRLETPFWLERDALGTPFREVRAKATVGDNVTIAQQTVTAIATPEMVTWTFGDGKTLDCHGAGKVEGLGDDVDCFHIYKMSSAHIGDGEKYTVEVDVSWSIAWTCAPVANCSAPAGVLPLHHEFDELLLAVGEIQTKAQ